HRRLGAGGDEPHHLNGRNRVDDLGGELDLGLGGPPERCPVRGGACDRIHRLRVGVPEHERPPGHHPVDVPAAVHVLDLGALAAAALTIAYSPETLYAATGTWNCCRTARITSR